MKKILSLFLAVMVIVGIGFTVFTITASANTAVAATESNGVTEKINQLVTLLEGKYFTVTGKACTCSDAACSNCSVTNVIACNWFEELFGYTLNKEQLPEQHRPLYAGGSWGSKGGYSCYGFANFAFWYIFAETSLSVSQYECAITDVYFTYDSVTNYAKPGDILRYEGADGRKHSMIYISCTQDKIKVLDCNFWGSDLVELHEFEWGTRGKCKLSITRASNYDEIANETQPGEGYKTLYRYHRYQNINNDEEVGICGHWVANTYNLSSSQVEKKYTDWLEEKFPDASQGLTHVYYPNSCPTYGCDDPDGTNYVRYTGNNEWPGKWYYEETLLVPENIVLTFHANSGVTPVRSKIVKYGEKYGELPIPTREGYTFKGWYWGWTEEYDQVTSDQIVSITEDTMVYAQWQLNEQYTITFHANGGTTPVRSKTVTYGEKYGELPIPTREGYIFKGWYWGWTEEYDQVTSEDIVYIGEDTMVYAHWMPQVKDIFFTSSEETVSVGDDFPLVLYIYPYISESEMGDIICNSEVPYKIERWTEADEWVAYKVIVSPTKVGTYTFSVEVLNWSTSCTLNVVPASVPVTGVTLDKSTATITVGNSISLKATVTPSEATLPNVIWSSSDPNVATVSSTGVVTAKSAGTTLITVETVDGNKTACCAVTVKDATVSVTGVSLNKTSATLTEGESLTFTATVAPENATNKNVTWSSSDTNVATVSSSGVVTAKSAGTATITVKTADESKTATCIITVSQTIDENKPTIRLSNVSVIAGQEVKIDIIAENMPDVVSLMFLDFEYDSTALELTESKMCVDNAFICDWSNGIATIAFESPTKINDVLMTLTFKTTEKMNGIYTVSCKSIVKGVVNGSETTIEHNNILGQVTLLMYERGDVNGDGTVDRKDAIHLLRHTMLPSRFPINQNGDVNGDGIVDRKDAIHLLRHTMLPSRFPLV